MTHCLDRRVVQLTHHGCACVWALQSDPLPYPLHYNHFALHAALRTKADSFPSPFSVALRRPPLEPKLVGRPPFRFLRDVVAEVIKQTEYLGGLYEPEEIKAEQPDKAAKMAFLQKAIDAHGSSLLSFLSYYTPSLPLSIVQRPVCRI